jgi:hypothetical protein
MALNKVVLQFKNKRVLKGKTFDFSQNKEFFHLQTLNNKVHDIHMEKLKAVFFVRDFLGNKNRYDRYRDVIPGGGRKINVQFLDGEIVTGFTLSFNPGRNGFFMTPASLKGNNSRIFVIKSATEDITFTERHDSFAVLMSAFAY